MTEEEMIWVASWAFVKKLEFEELKYSDNMYGNEHLIEEVWEYVNEIEEIGTSALKKSIKILNYIIYE